jgi:hypothetical protein
MEKKDQVFRKETSFVGYFSSCYETDFLSKDMGDRLMQRWFRDYAKSLAGAVKIHKQTEREVEGKDFINLGDLIPSQAYQLLSRELKTRFRFRIIVEAQRVKPKPAAPA